MCPSGWFIPVHDSGMQALYSLDLVNIYQPSNQPKTHVVSIGNKGVLCRLGIDALN
jgi:hypothetical protein